MFGALCAAVGWKPETSPNARTSWTPHLRKLAACTPEEQRRFAGWCASSAYVRENPHLIGTFLAREVEAFINMGCPVTKIKAATSGQTGQRGGRYGQRFQGQTFEDMQAE